MMRKNTAKVTMIFSMSVQIKRRKKLLGQFMIWTTGKELMYFFKLEFR
jgi:hypothetical protein